MAVNIVGIPALGHCCGDCRWQGCCALCAHPATGPSGRLGSVRKGASVYHQGDDLEYLYFIRSGSAKSVVTTQEGIEQIVAFHFAGDLVGMDAFADGVHNSNLVVLETSAVCRISMAKLKLEIRSDECLWDAYMAAIANGICRRQDYEVMLARKSAPARLAVFLCAVAAAHAGRGCSSTEFYLSMSRQDIANYLSMAVETLSRLVGDFQRRGLLTVERRYVRINDPGALHALGSATRDGEPG